MRQSVALETWLPAAVADECPRGANVFVGRPVSEKRRRRLVRRVSGQSVRVARHVSSPVAKSRLLAGAIAGSMFRTRSCRRKRQTAPRKKADEAENMAADVGRMKELVRQRYREEHAAVCEDLYRKTGIWQRIARHRLFEVVTLAVVLLNALWLGFDMDLEGGALRGVQRLAYQAVEHAFCAYFALECFVRFRSYRRKRDAFRDGRFIFDSTLTLGTAVGTWVLPALSFCSGGALAYRAPVLIPGLLRFARIAITVRLFGAVPELVILVRGMMASIRAIVVTVGLFWLLIYVFALLFRQLSSSSPVLQKLYFGSVPDSMNTLMVHGIFMDNLGTVVRTIGAESSACVALFWFFVCISSLTVMNMLIAAVCQSIATITSSEKERSTMNFVNNKMRNLLQEVDVDFDGKASISEFLLVLQTPEAVDVLAEAGVDVLSLVDHVEAVFVAEDVEGSSDNRTLDYDELVNLVLSHRGGCHASARDVIELRKFVRTIVAQTNNHLTRIETRITKHFEGLAADRSNGQFPGLEISRWQPPWQQGHDDPAREVVPHRSEARCACREGRPRESLGGCSVL